VYDFKNSGPGQSRDSKCAGEKVPIEMVRFQTIHRLSYSIHLEELNLISHQYHQSYPFELQHWKLRTNTALRYVVLLRSFQQQQNPLTHSRTFRIIRTIRLHFIPNPLFHSFRTIRHYHLTLFLPLSTLPQRTHSSRYILHRI
jgi:hypothetical protein